MRLARISTTTWIVLALCGCAAGRRMTPVSPQPATPSSHHHTAHHAKRHTTADARLASAAGEVGLASYYSGRHGRMTASGVPYDEDDFTAAHPTLPFGCRVRVTNLANQRSVVVTVIDRGPFVRGRIIDVSRRAARMLGFVREGLARVRVEMAGR